eukprot:gnl/MRDRNA2_/MRDRNA2_97217_c0_seq1.p1 gnl/MRDRNA2_/MRDRNA2_97217_c0~~gnl/MRDRNA2_/MRDRNA2_97217_c0_seq1.p1  ORF type:complete len:290 (+),score=59.38 gnl/MRDRNA2_/MRDRNA2_97217_c0_seq1:98-967(+)
MMHQCRPSGRAAASIQVLWRHLACRRRQRNVIQCPSNAISEGRHTGSASTLVASFLEIPEVLQAHVLMLSGNTGVSSLCLTSVGLYRSIWQSREIWQAALMSMGIPTQRSSLGDLVDEYRWRSCGIDALCRPGNQSVGVALLASAKCAVRGLIKEDAPFMDLISMSLADLLRWYDHTDGSAHHAAEMLLQDIKERSHLFASDHIREISAAFDSACSLRDLLLPEEIELFQEDDDVDDLAMYNCMELLQRTSDTGSTFDDMEIDLVDGCDNEAGERIMELLRSLPDSEGA